MDERASNEPEEGAVRQPIERYIEASRKLDLTGIDWAAVKEYPLSDEALKTLIYMMDVEGYTIVYMRDLLNTSLVDDAEIARFFTLWGYEEMFHSEALERFLAELGVSFPSDRRAALRRGEHALDRMLMGASGLLSRFFPDFAAIYLVWGAINELTTLHGYQLLAERANHPVLSELLRRIVKDERRHFSFYYWKARERLTTARAQKLASAMVRRFWRPVGNGVKDPAEVEAMIRYLMKGETGVKATTDIDSKISALPGFSWFQGMKEAVGRAMVGAT